MPAKFQPKTTAAMLAVCLPFLAGCEALAPIPTVAEVDLKRFSGDWYVIASIPTFLEKGAHNAVENYELRPDGNIATTFTYRSDSFTGPLKKFEATGYVKDTESNAIWGMQFIWPIKADYRIIYLDDDYTKTVIARNKRDYVWIMARSSVIPDAEYARLVELIAAQGYDVSDLVRVPQQPR